MQQGYKKKPLIIVIISLIYLLNPIGNYLFTVFETSYGPIGVLQQIAQRVADGNLLVIFSLCFYVTAVVLAIGIYKVRVWAFYFFVIHSVLIIVLNIITLVHNGFSAGIIINLLFLFPMGLLLQKEIRAPYFNPRLRWWEQAQRYIHTLVVKLDNKMLETFDISTSGCFLKKNDGEELEKGKLYDLEIDIEELVIKCKGEVMRETEGDAKYPAGWGIRFEGISPIEKRKLALLLKGSHKSGEIEETR